MPPAKKRSDILRVRLLPAEGKALQKYADRLNLSRSAAARQILRDALGG